MNNLIHFTNKLELANIFYLLRKTRNDAVSIDVSVPGERWEIDFLDDGSIEVEIFTSDGTIHDASILSELFDKHSH